MTIDIPSIEHSSIATMESYSPRPLSPLEIVSSVESDNDKQEDPLSEAGSPRSESDEDQNPLNLNITVDSVDDAISG